MKWITLIFGVCGLLAVPASGAWTQTGSPSLGEVARQYRKNKPASTAKVFDNDNLPTQSTISVTGPAPASEEAKTEDGDKETKEAAKSHQDNSKQPNQAEQRKKMQEEIAAKLNNEKQKIADISRELDLLNREMRVQASEYYMDPASRLRDPQKWNLQQLEYRDKIAAKQSQIEEERGKLNELQEAGRKAGLPSSAME